ncbi:hypothetical protein [Moorena sp. SIO3I6]|uniref:hypothetical protein n=1 Tax=Moorena sp. SIO3I6 TaxID=2607831 RepID=UPI0013FA25D6|nr:hypothetical protein [Moorena sp. SIO3I6]NEP26033.1 hypothetical protein [Moorena sp. SIO3I6]
MLDLSSSQALDYEYQGQKYTIQVYGDNQSEVTRYILPQPVIETGTDGLPKFSLTEFNNAEQVTGQCNLQTVLITPPGAVNAVRDKFGPETIIGAWEWSAGTAYFNYQYPNDQGELQSFSAPAWPSLTPTTTTGGVAQTSGQAAWTVSLPSQAAVASFIGAFGPGGNGAFSVEYQMEVPGSLPGVTVTIAFDSTIAYTYEQEIDVDKNVWGSVTSRTVTINQYLNSSGAGSIDYVWGAIDPESSQGQQIQNWANQTLRNAVQQSVDDAIALLEQNVPQGNEYTFSMSQVSSFSTVYSSNQVVIWVAQSSTQLPAFSESEWDSLYQQVNTAPLSVVFALQNTNLKANKINSITISVTSPSGSDRGTLTDKDSTWTFSKPAVSAGNQPNFTYSYSYSVAYSNGTSWESPKIEGDAAPSGQTSETINAGDLRALAVTIQTTNINYDTDVDYVEVDFSFTNTNTAPGIPAETVTRNNKFQQNNDPWEVQFYTAVPYTTPYQYAVKYVMKNGSTVELAPASPQNTNQVFITSAVYPKTYFLNVVWPEPGSPDVMKDLFLQANYVDPNNTVSVPPQMWQLPTKPPQPPTPWQFQAPLNTNAYVQILTAQYTLNNQIIQLPLPLNVLPGTVINVSYKQTPFMITIEPSLVKWADDNSSDGNQMVIVNAYLLQPDGRTMTQQRSFQFTKGTGVQYYSFLLEGPTPELEWYYTLQYFSGGEPIETPQQSTTSSILILPSTLSAQRLMANTALPLEAAVSMPRLKAAHQKLYLGQNTAAKTPKHEYHHMQVK